MTSELPETTELLVTISSDTPITSEDLEEAAQQLRNELRELEGVRVYPIVAGDAPAGSRSDAHLMVGAFGVSLWTVALGTKMVVDVVKEWTHRNDRKSVSIHEPDGTHQHYRGYSQREVNQMDNRGGRERMPEQIELDTPVHQEP